MLPVRPLVLLLTLAMVAAGCIGKDDPAPETAPETNDTPTMNTTLPDGREFVAAAETNKTEEGVGGIDHKHDYWEGKETVVIFDRDVSQDLTPIFERGDNTKVFTVFINLDNISEEDPRPALVYEGTGKVIFELSGGLPTTTEYQLTYRTAGKDWSEWVPIASGSSFEYEPEMTETDMPHSFRSLWNWKLQAVGPVPITGDPTFFDTMPLHVTITVVKSRSVLDWPGHPAFYDGVEERVVALNKPGSTTVQQAADVLIYGVEPDQVVPDKLVSMGSRTLDVYVNITQLNLPPGVPNGGFTLYWRTADTRPDDLGIFSIANETDDTTFAYWHLMLEDDMVDSPYQPTSRFGFKVLANPVNDDEAACYRCVPYTIEYTMTVIARPDPEAVPATLE